LLSILGGSQNVSAIRDDTGIHPETLSTYLKRLAKEGFIRIETKGWKKGKSKPCSITEAGTNWLINTSMLDVLGVLSRIFSQLIKPENRKVFQKVREEKYLRSEQLIKNHFFECHKKGVDPFKTLESLDEWEYKHRFKLTDVDKPIKEALKKLYALMLYFWSVEPLKRTLKILKI